MRSPSALPPFSVVRVLNIFAVVAVVVVRPPASGTYAAAFSSSPSSSSSTASCAGRPTAAAASRPPDRRPQNPTGRSPRRRRSGGVSSVAPLPAQILSDLANEYQNLVAYHPLETQSATFGTFAGVGDAVAQSRDEEVERYDVRRSARFVIKGLGAGLIWSAWYPLAEVWSTSAAGDVLSKLDIPDEGTAHAVAKTASSILLEQFAACPVVYSLWDIPVPTLLSGAPLSSVPGAVREKVPGLLWDNAKVWTFANVIIYNLPVNWRVFAVSVAEIFWASIVSAVATKKVESDDAVVDDVNGGGGGRSEEDMIANGSVMEGTMDFIAAGKVERIAAVSRHEALKSSKSPTAKEPIQAS